jgi:hypothetical protein
MSDEPWKVQQFCYFWIASQVVSAAEVTEVLGLAADQATVMGSRRMSPTPVPVEHAWTIRCDRHARIDEQAGEVLRRIEPVADKVRSLVDRGDVQAGLMLVRKSTTKRAEAASWAGRSRRSKSGSLRAWARRSRQTSTAVEDEHRPRVRTIPRPSTTGTVADPPTVRICRR